MEALAKGIPVLYNSVVTDIAYSRGGVSVTTAAGKFTSTAPCRCSLKRMTVVSVFELCGGICITRKGHWQSTAHSKLLHIPGPLL